MVSSPNDLFKPDNILFDGQGVWLVDWEAAFLNDRYADLAVVANLVVAHMFYAMGFLFPGSAVKPVNLSENAPEFRDFHQRFWAGEVSLADNNMKVAYGRLHGEQLLVNVRQPRFDEALRIVSDRHPRP